VSAQTHFERLLTALEPSADWQRTSDLIVWYTRTTLCPHKGRAIYGASAALANTAAHTAFVDSNVGVIIASLEASGDLDELDPLKQAFVRRVKLSLESQQRLPKDFVGQFTEATSAAGDAWATARQSNDFGPVTTTMENVLGLLRKKAHFLGGNTGDANSMYTALLGQYEPGFTTERLLSVMGVVTEGLAPLRKRFLPYTSTWKFPTLSQWQPTHADNDAMCTEIVANLGFDFTRGGMTTAGHPFCTTLSPDNVAITYRYVGDVPLAGFFGAAHETGHALYEQHVLEFIQRYHPPGYLISLGVHESQSRLVENILLRDPKTARHLYVMLGKNLPAGAELAEFRRYMNRTTETPIRVESDELAYNLHIALRVELEIAMLSGELKLEDVPAAFAKRMGELLGITPEEPVRTAWQDIHWSSGSFGYFGTYMLGNLAGAQLMNAFSQAEPQWRWAFVKGDFSLLWAWLYANVWRGGHVSTLDEVLLAATGETLNPQYWLNYIDAKYTALCTDNQ